MVYGEILPRSKMAFERRYLTREVIIMVNSNQVKVVKEIQYVVDGEIQPPGAAKVTDVRFYRKDGNGTSEDGQYQLVDEDAITQSIINNFWSQIE